MVALEGQLKARGINIVKEQFSVQAVKLFGVIDTDYQPNQHTGFVNTVLISGNGTLSWRLMPASDPQNS